MINLKDASKKYIIAFVGASNNPDKYGHKVLKNMLAKGFRCIPVNPKETEILGQKAYPDLTCAAGEIASAGGQIDLVDFIVPPPVTLRVLGEVKKLGIKNVWMQPGSESAEAVKYCAENGIECIHGACIMLETDS